LVNITGLDDARWHPIIGRRSTGPRPGRREPSPSAGSFMEIGCRRVESRPPRRVDRSTRFVVIR